MGCVDFPIPVQYYTKLYVVLLCNTVCMCTCLSMHVFVCHYYMFICVFTYAPARHFVCSNARSRGSTDESLDEDEESLLEVEDVTAYLRFNKEVCIYVHCFSFLIPVISTQSSIHRYKLLNEGLPTYLIA